MQSKYWKYKAFDASGQVYDGITAGIDPYVVMLEVRQGLNLEVCELVLISESEYLTLHKSQNKLNRLIRLSTDLSKKLIDKSGVNVAAQEQPKPSRGAGSIVVALLSNFPDGIVCLVLFIIGLIAAAAVIKVTINYWR